jgi:hypothetical protein
LDAFVMPSTITAAGPDKRRRHSPKWVGYCAFAIPAETVREKLGAVIETPKQLMLAFELGRRRLLQAVEQKALPGTGERITLSTADL